MELENVNTSDLVEELRKREGVDAHWAEPHKDFVLKINGPAVVIIVTD